MGGGGGGGGGAYPDLNFVINMVEICQKLSEIYHFEFELTNQKLTILSSQSSRPFCLISVTYFM